MKKIVFLLAPFVFLTFSSSALAVCPCQSTGQTSVETVVKNEASGEDASVKTEISNVVNQKETTVQATGPGEIRVEVKNGQVEIESSTEVSPTVKVSQESSQPVEATKTSRSFLVILEDFIAHLRELIFSSLFPAY